ncbi:MAG: NF038122 family metalloprotease [Pirellulaceae bacterium]
MSSTKSISWFSISLLSLYCAASAQAGLVININAGANLAANTQAMAAFERAAAQFENIFADDIVVNIDADLGAFANPNTIGSASSVILNGDHDLVVGAMKADALADNDSIIAFLPSAAQVNWSDGGAGTNGMISAHKANLKALGFTGLDTAFGANDATITFNQAFNFDFDNSDGVGAGLTDFETVAAHEIGHALGFSSVVDAINAGATNVAPRTLDLFRFETASVPMTEAEFTLATRSIRPGVNEAFSDTENVWRFSTGLGSGGGRDGRQASHWKADELTGTFIGLLDPTLASGVFYDLATADIRALDLIGYDFIVAVPEPSSIALVGLAACMGLRRRRRSGTEAACAREV